MADDDDDKATGDALKALAAAEGKTTDEVLAELLQARAEKKKREGAGSRSTEIERGREQGLGPLGEGNFRGNSLTSPRLSRERIATYESESAAEARERWEQEESELPGGVFSPGGMSGGGIFGDGAIATEGYDPAAEARFTRMASDAAQVRTARILERIEPMLEEFEARRRLPGRQPAQLPGRRRGR